MYKVADDIGHLYFTDCDNRLFVGQSLEGIVNYWETYKRVNNRLVKIDCFEDIMNLVREEYLCDVIKAVRFYIPRIDAKYPLECRALQFFDNGDTIMFCNDPWYFPTLMTLVDKDIFKNNVVLTHDDYDKLSYFYETYHGENFNEDRLLEIRHGEIEIRLHNSFSSALYDSKDALKMLQILIGGKIKSEVCGRANTNAENWTWAHVRRAMTRIGCFGKKPEDKSEEYWEDYAVSDSDFGHAIHSCDTTIPYSNVRTQCINHKNKRGDSDENIVLSICEYLKPIQNIIDSVHNSYSTDN